MSTSTTKVSVELSQRLGIPTFKEVRAEIIQAYYNLEPTHPIIFHYQSELA